jgi:hypothetical protein
MIRVRVDDFPQTKAEPQHTPQAFRDFHRELSALLGGRRYLLGVIPGRCSADDILLLRNETDCVIGMHGIRHDEALLDLYGNEFPPYESRAEVRRQLAEAREALIQAVGRPVRIYMPPRNSIDMRTLSMLAGVGFDFFTSGPETDRTIIKNTLGVHIHSQPPHEYGRSDELLRRESHLRLMESSDAGRDVVLALHWTWETNIGLSHLREFLSRIPDRYFRDFDV